MPGQRLSAGAVDLASWTGKAASEMAGERFYYDSATLRRQRGAS